MTDQKRSPQPPIRYIKRFTNVEDIGYAPGPLFEMHGQYGRYILVLQALDGDKWVDVPTEAVPEEDLTDGDSDKLSTT